MAELELKRLREVRRRAQVLLSFVTSDLGSFIHEKDKVSFRRKPESLSISGDVNVTTTCSCVMALAVSNTFRKFYDAEHDVTKAKETARDIFKGLARALWMSSGLTANNPFSTTLVLRTFGFLQEEKLLELSDVEAKPWELYLGIAPEKAVEFAAFLKTDTRQPAKYLYASLSDRTRRLMDKSIPRDADELKQHRERLRAAIALDIQRLIQSGYIYSETKFPDISSTLKSKLSNPPIGYELARLNQGLFVEQFPAFLPISPSLDLSGIAEQIGQSPENFGINEYEPTATVLYWFVDALERGGMSLDGKTWERLCKWATQEFNRERSLVLADHDAMMDPVAMAMAGCLCAKLRNLAAQGILGTGKAHREMLPSIVELEHSIQALFKRQTSSGIWPKYFPLFHYQDAGSNFCFTFEMLEAVLCEFGRSENRLLDQKAFINGLDKAVSWCEKNRLHCSEGGADYFGWNSGGDIESLEKERPESWATAVVHMFLWELNSVLSQRIQKRILEKYKARAPKKSIQEMMKASAPMGKSLAKLQDIQLFIHPRHESLVTVLTNDLLSAHFGKTENQMRRERARGPFSALLFGPPGTSKTQVTKAIADDLGWPMVEINPSEFVKGSFENVYLQAEEIFTDLMDLSAAVILFDEMDALTQKRGPGDDKNSKSHLDTATQFLTTSMLPKLTALHDNRGVVFFMATNFQENFDPAIKRAGRFDLLLCMGPPTTDEKIKKLECFFDPWPATDQKDKAAQCIMRFLRSSKRHQNIFALLTFGDCKSLLGGIGSYQDIGDRLETFGKVRFLQRLSEYGETIGLKYQHVMKLGRGDITLEEIDGIKLDLLEKLLKTKKIDRTDLGRYLCDRRASKRQF